MSFAFPSEIQSLEGMWQLYRQSPLALALVTIMVAGYAYWKFGTPTNSILNNPLIYPPKRPKLLTTFLRYQLGAGLYLAAWLFLFGVLCFSPSLLYVALQTAALSDAAKSVANSIGTIIGDDRAKLADTMPVAAALLMVVVGKLPLFSQVEEMLRTELNSMVAIPVRAILLRNDLKTRPLALDDNFLKQVALERALPNVQRHYRSIYDDWLKARYLCDQLASWQGHVEFSKFSIRYGAERDAILTAVENFLTELAILDAPRRSAKLNELAKKRSEEIGQLIQWICAYVSYAVLATFTTTRAREDALAVIGFRGKATSPDFPLDLGALALTLTGVFGIIALSAFLVYSVPAAVYGGEATTDDWLALHKAVRMGFWGTVMHFGTILLVLQTLGHFGENWIGRWLGGTSGGRPPVALYLALGVVGFLLGGTIAVIARLMVRGEFFPGNLAWGSITFVTAVATAWHQDRVAARTHSAASGTTARFADWRVSALQGGLTALAAMLAYLYVSTGAGQSLKWQFCIFLLVSSGCTGSFLGWHLPLNMRRRLASKEAQASGAPSHVDMTFRDRGKADDGVSDAGLRKVAAHRGR